MILYDTLNEVRHHLFYVLFNNLGQLNRHNMNIFTTAFFALGDMFVSPKHYIDNWSAL